MYAKGCHIDLRGITELDESFKDEIVDDISDSNLGNISEVVSIVLNLNVVGFFAWNACKHSTH